MKSKHILMIVNTYFQLIVAISLKLNNLKDDNVDIIISDRSRDSDLIYNNIKKQNIFENCYKANINFVSKHKKNYIHKILRLVNRNSILKHINMQKYEYDYLYFYNKDILSITVMNECLKNNQNLKICRFEEGFGSYLSETFLGTERLNQIINKLKINDLTEFYYCYNPDLMLLDEQFEYKKIFPLNRDDANLKNIINSVFGYDGSNEEYKEKYIFFEESFFCEKKKINDLELVLKIADIVGRENLLVKLHPRSKVDRFKEYGISTNKTIGIPWEVIQLNNDFSDKVFLTISSGSVLASKLYFNDNIKTYLLFNCTEQMSDMVTDKYHRYLEKVEEKFGLNGFIIPEDADRFEKLLKKDLWKQQ